MRIVLQRVSQSQVRVDGAVVGEIGRGLLALVGIGHHDQAEDAVWLANKTSQLRIFPDDAGKMNRSVIDIGGSVLAISQFTLLGDCRKGRRPAFTDAADPPIANQLYQEYITQLRSMNIEVQTGIFAADMKVSLINDGPVTLILDRCAADLDS